MDHKPTIIDLDAVFYGPVVRDMVISTGRLDALESAIAKLGRMARKMEIAPPFLQIDRQSRREEKQSVTMLFKSEDGAYTEDRPDRVIEVMDARLILPPGGFQVEGAWRVAAVLRATDAGEHEVFGRPGLAPLVAKKMAKEPLRCDHCERNSARIRSLILEDRGTGEFKQVGAECAQAYVGDRADAQIKQIEFFTQVLETVNMALDPTIGSGEVLSTFAPEKVLALSCASIRASGWVPSRDERGYPNSDSTGKRVRDSLCEPSHETRIEVTPEDEAQGAKMLEWVRSLTPEQAVTGGTYLMSMADILGHDWVSEKRLRFVASAPRAYKRHLETKVREVFKSISAHQGAVGAKLAPFPVKLERLNSYDSQYGTTFIFTFRDDGGNAFVWKTKSCPITEADVDRRILISGTVKEHSEFRSEKQTELLRVKVAEFVEPKPVREAPLLPGDGKKAKAKAKTT
jgi:hypothetical protein